MGLQKFIADAQASGELPSNFTLTPLTPALLFAKFDGAFIKDVLMTEAIHAANEARKESLHAGKRLGLLSTLASVPDGITTLEKLDAYLGINERDMWGDYLHISQD